MEFETSWKKSQRSTSELHTKDVNIAKSEYLNIDVAPNKHSIWPFSST